MCPVPVPDEYKNKLLRVGPLVLTKVKGFPHWPGEVFDFSKHVQRPTMLAKMVPCHLIEEWKTSVNQSKVLVVAFGDNTFAWFKMEELQAFSVEDLIAEVKAKIIERSAGGIKGIARIFKAMDDNGNRQLDIDDFRWGFIDYGFNLTQEEARKLLEHFDRNGDGVISYDEFLRALKVSPSPLPTLQTTSQASQSLFK